MPCRETDGLRAGEVEIIAAEEGGNFATELVGELGVCFDADGIEIGD